MGMMFDDGRKRMRDVGGSGCGGGGGGGGGWSGVVVRLGGMVAPSSLVVLLCVWPKGPKFDEGGKGATTLSEA
jgi:hypothetical protein